MAIFLFQKYNVMVPIFESKWHVYEIAVKALADNLDLLAYRSPERLFYFHPVHPSTSLPESLLQGIFPPEPRSVQ